MAITTIRTTYALDAETVRTLERIARRWGTSKSEALRRAIRSAAAAEAGAGSPDPLRALDGLQRAAALTASRAAEWARESRRERRAAAGRREKALA